MMTTPDPAWLGGLPEDEEDSFLFECDEDPADVELREHRIREERRLIEMALGAKWPEAESIAADMERSALYMFLADVDGIPPFGVHSDSQTLSWDVVKAAAVAFINRQDYSRAVEVLRAEKELLNYSSGCFLLALAFRGLSKLQLSATAARLALSIGSEQEDCFENVRKAARAFLKTYIRFGQDSHVDEKHNKELVTYLENFLDENDEEASEDELSGKELENPPLDACFGQYGSKEERSKRKIELLLKRGTYCLTADKYALAEQCFSQLRAHCANAESDTGSSLVLSEYLIAITLMRSGQTARAMQQLNTLSDTHPHLLQSEVLYVKGRLFLQMKHLQDAMNATLHSLQLLSNEQTSPDDVWPGYLVEQDVENSSSKETEKLFPEARRASLQSILQLQKSAIRAHLPADAVCRYTECVHLKQVLPNRREIFAADDGYKGHYVFTCTEKCSIAFHHGCFKHYKEMCTVNGEDWIADVRCFTPDCLGFLETADLVKEHGHKKQVGKRKAPPPAEGAPPPPATPQQPSKASSASSAQKKKQQAACSKAAGGEATAPAEPATKSTERAAPAVSSGQATGARPKKMAVRGASPTSLQSLGSSYIEPAQRLRALRENLPRMSGYPRASTQFFTVDGQEGPASEMNDMLHGRLKQISRSLATETKTRPSSKSAAVERKDDMTFYLYHLVRRLCNRINVLESELKESEEGAKGVQKLTKSTQTAQWEPNLPEAVPPPARAPIQAPIGTKPASSMETTLSLEQVLRRNGILEPHASEDPPPTQHYSHIPVAQSQPEMGEAQPNPTTATHFSTLNELEQLFPTTDELDDFLDAKLDEEPTSVQSIPAGLNFQPLVRQPPRTINLLDDLDALDSIMENHEQNTVRASTGQQSLGDNECCICHMELDPGQRYTLACGHNTFHEECMRTWLKHNSNCPLCRYYVKLPEEYPNLR